MNAYLEGDGTLRGRPHIASIGTYTSSRHPEQGGILAFGHRHTENAIDAACGTVVDEAHLIDIHLLGAAVGQQGEVRVEGILPCLVESTLPESVEVGRALGGGLELLGRESRGAQSHIVLAIDMGSDFQPIESRLLERACPLHGAILEGDILLLSIRIHHWSGLEIDHGAGQERARLTHVDHKLGFLASAVVPVLVVGGDGDHDIVAPDLCAGGDDQTEEDKE